MRACQIALCAEVWLVASASSLVAETLLPMPPLADEVAALPRMGGDGEIATRINAALQELDDNHLAIVTCDDGNAEDAFRSVDTLSDGPTFLSFVITVGGYCDGAAHPWAMQEVANFDLGSGAKTSLREFLPPAWSGPGKSEGPLLSLYLDAMEQPFAEDCVDSIIYAHEQHQLGFDLGLDQKAQKLMLLPEGLPYVVSGCEEAAWVSVDQLRAAGFHPRLVQALGGTP